jgi:glycerol-3-phosphate acyltransferase PlsY
MLTAGLIVLASYLLGGVSVAYATGRLLRGIDLRQYGSGNLGPSNVWQQVSRPATIPVGLLEIGQGMIGIAVAKAADQSLGVQVAAGLAAIAGHNWSPLLRLNGGRGVGPAIGFMLVLSPLALGVFIVVSLAGVVLRVVPQFVLAGLIAAPFVALGNGQAPEIVVALSVMAALVAAKRLLTNRPSLPPGADPVEVLLCRLMLDRDTRERERWVGRTTR